MKDNKDQATLDLFADGKEGNTTFKYMKVENLSLEEQACLVFDQLISSKKQDFQNLEAENKGILGQLKAAVAFIMQAKKVAIERAKSGEKPSAISYLVNTELATNVSLLNQHMLSIMDIPSAK